MAIDHTRGNQATLQWLFYDGHGNLVQVMFPHPLPLSRSFGRGVSRRRRGEGSCANLGHPEDETGLVYMRARYYEPLTGRFISEDPSRDGVNWYLYADGNPVIKNDPDGQEGAIVELSQAMSLQSFLALIAARFNAILLQSTARLADVSKVATGSKLYHWLLQHGEDPNAWRMIVGEISGPGSGFLKAWVRYQAGQVWAYIQAEAGELFQHATPYIDQRPWPR